MQKENYVTTLKKYTTVMKLHENDINDCWKEYDKKNHKKKRFINISKTQLHKWLHCYECSDSELKWDMQPRKC